MNTKTISRLRLVVTVVCTLMAGVGGYISGSYVDASTQQVLMGAILSVAAIIFGVMGAWIAIVYPDALKKLSDRTCSDPLDQLGRMRQLYPPIYIASIVIVALLIAGPVGAVLRSTLTDERHAEVARSLGFAVICGLSALLVIAVAYCVWPLAVADQDIQAKADRRDIELSFSGKAEGSRDL